MLKYVLFQHLTRILLQYICNANEIQNKVQERSDGALDANIIGKTKCDGIQNQMRLFGGRVSPKRKATKISHTHTKKHRSNGF